MKLSKRNKVIILKEMSMGYESITVFWFVFDFCFVSVVLSYAVMRPWEWQGSKPNPPQCFHVPCPPFSLTTKTAPMSNDTVWEIVMLGRLRVLYSTLSF